MSRASAAAAGAALCLAVATPARAQREGVQRVGILRLDFDGSIPEAGRDLLGARLVEGLAVARFEVFAGATVASKLTATGVKPGCRDGTCYPDAARALGVGYLVVAKVSASEKNYDISLELINGRTGASLGQKRERCEVCGIEEAGEKMGLAASSLRERLEALAKGPARFVIRSKPAGARASIDGQPAGATPIDTELGAGQHQLRLAAEGYEPSERSFIVVSGVDETLDIDLVQLPDTFPWKAVGWTGVLVGVAAIAGGVVAVSMDGDEITCTAAEKDAMGHCPYVRSSSALGAALIGVGAAAVVGGGLSLYLGSLGGARHASDSADARDRGKGGRAWGLVATGTF